MISDKIQPFFDVKDKRIPKGWRRLRFGEMRREGYMFWSFHQEWRKGDVFARNTSLNKLRIIKK